MKTNAEKFIQIAFVLKITFVTKHIKNKMFY